MAKQHRWSCPVLDDMHMDTIGIDSAVSQATHRTTTVIHHRPSDSTILSILSSLSAVQSPAGTTGTRQFASVWFGGMKTSSCCQG
jgi:hypothetical protein